MGQGRSWGAQAGMVTAEFAVAIPAVLAVAAVILSAISFGVAQGQACYEAGVLARSYAISEVRGWPGGPPPDLSGGPAYSVRFTGDLVVVRMSVPTRFGPDASCEMTAVVEDRYR